MRKFKRVDEPLFLKANWEKWGKEWESAKRVKPGAKFDWRQHEGEKVNHKLMPILRGQVNSHCSFCNNFPISPPSNETIEHFQPKAKFPLVAYKWGNLYYCCDFCQAQKKVDFDPDALVPDSEEYEFGDYFYWDYTNGYLCVRPDIDDARKRRAKATIKLYGLNNLHPSYRLRILLQYAKLQDWDINDLPYTSFLEQ